MYPKTFVEQTDTQPTHKGGMVPQGFSVFSTFNLTNAISGTVKATLMVFSSAVHN